MKPREYLPLRSLQAYVVASQDRAACFVWLSGADGEFKSDPVPLIGHDKSIDIPALSLSIPLAQVYRGFPAAPATGT